MGMKLFVKESEKHILNVDGEDFEVCIVQIPFREGVEVRCPLGEEELRVSDRGLGEHEALRLMEEEIRKWRGVLDR